MIGFLFSFSFSVSHDDHEGYSFLLGFSHFIGYEWSFDVFPGRQFRFLFHFLYSLSLSRIIIWRFVVSTGSISFHSTFLFRVLPFISFSCFWYLASMALVDSGPFSFIFSLFLNYIPAWFSFIFFFNSFFIAFLFLLVNLKSRVDSLLPHFRFIFFYFLLFLCHLQSSAAGVAMRCWLPALTVTVIL